MTDVLDLPKPKVLLCFDEDGDWSIVTDLPSDVICVDERVPDDRVYRMQPQPHGRQLVKDIIGACPVGHLEDERLSDAEIEALRDFLDE